MSDKAKTATNTDNKSSRNSPTTDRTSESMHQLLDELTERVGDVETRVRQSSGQAGDNLRNSAENARQKSRALAGEIEGYVREHPVQAVGVAFLAGLVLSSMMKR